MAPAAPPGARRLTQGEIRWDLVTEATGCSSNDDGGK
jgi:hypothetical protein